MSREKDIDLIELYLQDHLNPADIIKLEERLRSDAEFEILYQEEKTIYAALQDKEGQVILQTINDVVSDKKKTPQVFSLKKYAWITSIAATILILIFVSVRNNKNISSQDLFDEYYETYPMVLANRGNSELELNQLIDAYREKDWETFHPLISATNSEELPLPLKDLYQAISHLERSNPVSAIEILERYRSMSVSHLYQHNIEWYLALSYLQNNNTAQAKNILVQLKEKVSDSTALDKDINQLLKSL